jgi:transposase InsO family protein
MRRHKVSQRRACQLTGQHRSTQRYALVIPDQEAELISAMNAVAMAHPRWGYRMAAKLLRDGGWVINDKKVERLWRQEGHRVPPSKAKKSGKKAEGSKQNSSRNRPALRPHHVWSYDFMSAWTTRRIPIRILNVVDEFTRCSLGSRVSRSIGSKDVIEHLKLLFERHGKPSMIRSDNGREFIASTVVEWLGSEGIEAVFVEKGTPQQNPFVERFNGTMRRDLINVEEFDTVTEARVMVGIFNEEYNTLRPHRSLGRMTPHAFAMSQNGARE